MDRTLKLLSKETASLLIKQAAHELKNNTLYMSFSNYFDTQGIESLALYFQLRAEEEIVHHDWIFTYLSNADCRLKYPIIEENTEQEITSLIDPFIATVKREIETTQLIYKIYYHTMTEKDFMTCSWLLSKLIPEQIEEENTSRMARTIMERDGDILIKAEKVLQLLNVSE